MEFKTDGKMTRTIFYDKFIKGEHFKIKVEWLEKQLNEQLKNDDPYFRIDCTTLNDIKYLFIDSNTNLTLLFIKRGFIRAWSDCTSRDDVKGLETIFFSFERIKRNVLFIKEIRSSEGGLK